MADMVERDPFALELLHERGRPIVQLAEKFYDQSDVVRDFLDLIVGGRAEWNS